MKQKTIELQDRTIIFQELLEGATEIGIAYFYDYIDFKYVVNNHWEFSGLKLEKDMLHPPVIIGLDKDMTEEMAKKVVDVFIYNNEFHGFANYVTNFSKDAFKTALESYKSLKEKHGITGW